MAEIGIGDIPGLDRALIQGLSSYQPGPVGVCYMSPYMGLSLPWVNWAEWGSNVQGTSETFAIGASTPQVVYRIPTNTRGYLHSVSLERASGDNTLLDLSISQPAGYGEGTRLVRLKVLGTAATSIWWPDSSGLQANTDRKVDMQGAMLLEPGAVIGVLPSGVGVATTTFDYEIILVNSYLTRAIVP